jgi:hypothetical protein
MSAKAAMAIPGLPGGQAAYEALVQVQPNPDNTPNQSGEINCAI